jgi:hypothetical protein
MITFFFLLFFFNSFSKGAAFDQVCQHDPLRCRLDAKTLSAAEIEAFLTGLPADAKQQRAARPKARVIYTDPGKDKYGMHDHGHGHDHDHAHAH